MNLKGLFSVKNICLFILVISLLLTGKLLWHLHSLDSSEQSSISYDLFFNKYSIERGEKWNKALEIPKDKNSKKVNFQQKDSDLTIDNRYVAMIGQQGEHYQQQTVKQIFQLSAPSSALGSHFLVKSQVNQQLFFLDQTQQKSDLQKIPLRKCLQLENIEFNDKVLHFVDENKNFWLISHPHNNVLFVQIYDCKNSKLLKKILHEPMHSGRKFLVNQLIGVEFKDNLFELKVLTYESHTYILKISTSYSIIQSILMPSHIIKSSAIELSKASSLSSDFTYTFLDPLNVIFKQEFDYTLYSILKKFMSQLTTLLNTFGVDAKTLNSYINVKIKEYEDQKAPQYMDYDIQVIDEENDCLVNLQYHVKQAEKQNTSSLNSSVTRLSKNILPLKTPIFHDLESYDPHDIVQILKEQKSPKVSQFKRISHDKGFEKEYSTDYYFSVYHTYPDTQLHFLGLGEKIFYLHPSENVKDQYLAIRSKDGALVLQGNKIRGVYEDRPLTKDQVVQNIFIQANQVVPGIWQGHAGYRALISIVNGSRLQLVNGLSGKTMLTSSLNLKQGYQYAGSYLFNNEWWIIQFHPASGLTELTKHQLYVQKAYPKQIDSVKRTYGKFINSEFQQNEDDLLIIFKEYLQHGKGVVVLDIFRCLDQFYYIQLCDTNGQNYAIARIHFKRLSNRLPKFSNDYSSDLERSLIVKPKDMIKEKQKMDPYLLLIGGNKQFFEGVKDLIKQGKFTDIKKQKYHSEKSNKIVSHAMPMKLNQFSLLPYSIISTQQWSDDSSSVQEISLINMRVLMENAKKQFMLQTKILARKRLQYFILFVIVIMGALIVKLLIKDDLQKIQEQREKQKQSEKNQIKKDKKDKSAESPKKDKKEKNK